jgi:hypothetical protein
MSKPLPYESLTHDAAGVMKHAGLYAGKKALIILGGTSSRDWEKVRQAVDPDVLLGANGVNALINNLDYWLCAENMTRSYQLAQKGDERSIEFMKMFNRNNAKFRLYSHWSWGLVPEKDNCICIRREGYEKGQIPKSFSFREYGNGLLNGWVFRNSIAGKLMRVGTVAAQLLHMAGILGVSEIHTIGLDLMFKDDASHHAYEYPIYQPDLWRKPGMFVEYKGVKTQHVWIDTADFFAGVEPFLARDGILWVDHSHGLLEVEGLACAKGAMTL